jgi:hypothetical protein
MTTLADCWRVYRLSKLSSDPMIAAQLEGLMQTVFYAGATGALRCLDQCDPDIWPARVEEIDEEVRRWVAQFPPVVEIKIPDEDLQ